MIKLLYGTSNKAKLESMEHMLGSINISLLNDNTIDLKEIEIDECGATPVENAKIKALAFYDALKLPVFSCDTGLYFKNVDEKYQAGCMASNKCVSIYDQPGVAVRRVNGKYLDDEEMIAYYANLAKLHGGELVAYYQNAISLVINEDEIYCYDGEDLNSEEFIITSKPHIHRTDGYPLDSLSIHMASGKFYMDLRGDTAHSYVLKRDLSEGFCRFFVGSVGASMK